MLLVFMKKLKEDLNILFLHLAEVRMIDKKFYGGVVWKEMYLLTD